LWKRVNEAFRSIFRVTFYGNILRNLRSGTHLISLLSLILLCSVMFLFFLFLWPELPPFQDGWIGMKFGKNVLHVLQVQHSSQTLQFTIVQINENQ